MTPVPAVVGAQVATPDEIRAVQDLFREYTDRAFTLTAGFRKVDSPADFPAALRPIVVFMEMDLRRA